MSRSVGSGVCLASAPVAQGIVSTLQSDRPRRPDVMVRVDFESCWGKEGEEECRWAKNDKLHSPMLVSRMCEEGKRYRKERRVFFATWRGKDFGMHKLSVCSYW
jgi:hypothetical protein